MFKLLTVTFLSCLFYTQAQGQVSVGVEGNIPRNGSVVNLTITLTGVPTAIVNNELDTFLRETALKIYIKSDPESSDKPVQWSGNGDGDYIANFNATYVGSEKQVRSSGDDYIVTVTALIRYQGTTSLRDYIEKNTMKVRAEYIESDEIEAEESEDVTILPDEFIANDKVSGLALTPAHKKIKVTWTPKSTINNNGGGTQEPSGLKIIVVDLGDGGANRDIQFEATIYQKESSDETPNDGVCSFTRTDDTCSISTCTADSGEEASAYLNISESIPSEGITVISTTDAGQKVIKGLENDNSYAVFTQYEPSSLQFSECLITVPVRNYSLTELNSDDLEAKPGKANCFIATAAYGTPFSPHIDRLRAFRDTLLITNPAGLKAVKLYYQYSPPIAQWISSSEPLKWTVRALLSPIIAWLFLVQDFPLVTATTCLALLVFLCYRKRPTGEAA